MEIFLTILTILLLLAFAFILVMFYCFMKVFYVKTRPDPKEEYPIPEGKVYQKHRAQLIKYIKAARSMSHKNVEITSHDGLKLRGKFYEYATDAPIELMLHGYRGNSERDLSGGIIRAFALGHSVLIVDLRGCGKSEGHIATFGILESKDCMAWIDYILDYIDFSAKIILTGVSMGAATVMMTATHEDLPQNVIGVLADCGYTSPKEIISKVVDDMGLPRKLIYPIIRLSGKVFGGFDIEEYSPLEAMERFTLPIIFFHGDDDKFVPKEMSIENFEACASPVKDLVLIEGADHGLAYITDPTKYVIRLRDFFAPIKDEDYDPLKDTRFLESEKSHRSFDNDSDNDELFSDDDGDITEIEDIIL